MAKLARVQATDEVSGVERAEEELGKATDVTPNRGAEAARETAAELADTPREGARSGLTVIGTAAERQNEMAQAAAREVAQLAPALGHLFGEQIRENLQVATAITNATEWNEVARIQHEFLRSSFARMHQLGELYRAAALDLLNSTAFTYLR
jgi:hypothetical protein